MDIWSDCEEYIQNSLAVEGAKQIVGQVQGLLGNETSQLTLLQKKLEQGGDLKDAMAYLVGLLGLAEKIEKMQPILVHQGLKINQKCANYVTDHCGKIRENCIETAYSLCQEIFTHFEATIKEGDNAKKAQALIINAVSQVGGSFGTSCKDLLVRLEKGFLSDSVLEPSPKSKAFKL